MLGFLIFIAVLVAVFFVFRKLAYKLLAGLTGTAGYTLNPQADGSTEVVVKAGMAPALQPSRALLVATVVAGFVGYKMSSSAPTGEMGWMVAAVVTWLVALVLVGVLATLFHSYDNNRHPGGTFKVTPKGDIEWPNGKRLDRSTNVHRLVLTNTARVSKRAVMPGAYRIVEALQNVSWRLDVQAGGKSYPLAGGMTEVVGEGLMREMKLLLDFDGSRAEASQMAICPFCAESIKLSAIKCKHCGSSLTPA